MPCQTGMCILGISTHSRVEIGTDYLDTDLSKFMAFLMLQANCQIVSISVVLVRCLYF